MKDYDGVGDTDVSSCNVLLQQQWHGSDTAFSGAKVMAELHQLWNQVGTTLCYPACSGCPGMPETLANSGFSQKCPISMGISEKHFNQAGRDRSFSRQEIGLLTYTFFTA